MGFAALNPSYGLRATIEQRPMHDHIGKIDPQEIALADKDKTDKANAQFKKMQRAEDGKKAMSEYEAEAVAIRAKTARLRALRMARDAAAEKAAQEAGPPKPAAGAKKTRAKRPTEKSATLSEWLADQQESGRRR